MNQKAEHTKNYSNKGGKHNEKLNHYQRKERGKDSVGTG